MSELKAKVVTPTRKYTSLGDLEIGDAFIWASDVGTEAAPVLVVASSPNTADTGAQHSPYRYAVYAVCETGLEFLCLVDAATRRYEVVRVSIKDMSVNLFLEA